MLNNFFECPWVWYFRNFLKLPEIKSASLSVGSAVHSAIEFILKEKSLPNKQQILTKIEHSLTLEGVTNQSDKKQFTDEAFLAVQNFLDTYYANLATDRASERSVSFHDKQFPNLSMYGKIDLTERFPDGSITVSDFKTGSSKTSGVIEKLDDEGRLSKYMRQLAMYSYLIHGAEKNTVSQSRLVFLEEDQKNKNALYSTRITSEQVDMLVRDIADYQNSLLDGSWTTRACYNTGHSGQICQYCARIQKILEK
jgi:RecB family exonuclease